MLKSVITSGQSSKAKIQKVDKEISDDLLKVIALAESRNSPDALSKKDLEAKLFLENYKKSH